MRRALRAAVLGLNIRRDELHSAHRARPCALPGRRDIFHEAGQRRVAAPGIALQRFRPRRRINLGHPKRERLAAMLNPHHVADHALPASLKRGRRQSLWPTFELDREDACRHVGRGAVCDDLERRRRTGRPGKQPERVVRPQTPAVTWQRKRGDCTEMSELAVAALRRAEVPARMVSGLAWIEGAWRPHAWVEFAAGATPEEGWATADPAYGVVPAPLDRVRLFLWPAEGWEALREGDGLGLRVRAVDAALAAEEEN